NGERVGQGSSRPYTFDFSNVERIFVQATHPEYLPELEIFDRARIEQMVAANLDVKLTLRTLNCTPNRSHDAPSSCPVRVAARRHRGVRRRSQQEVRVPH